MKRGFDLRKDVGNALINMYVNCGCLNETKLVSDRMILKDDISWGSIARGYVQHEDWQLALEIFRKMISEDIIKLNTFILLSMLKACAFRCFTKMVPEGFSPNKVAFLGALKACTILGDINKGRLLHNQIIQSGIDADIEMSSTLINMYSKCGNMSYAQEIFNNMYTKDHILWTALLTGYSQQGKSEHVFHLYDTMKTAGVQPNAITFLSLLNACSHSGLLYEAQMYFEYMSSRYGISPKIEHHTSLAIVFGTSGHFEMAMDVINRMPFSDNLTIWITLLGACRKWRNIRFARLAFDRVIQLDITCAPAYVLMADIYATDGMEEDAEKIVAMRMKHCMQENGD